MASYRRSTGCSKPNYSSPSISSGFASSTSTFSSRPSTFYNRSVSAPSVNLYGHSVRLSLDRPVSPNRSISTVFISKPPHQVVKRQSSSNSTKKTCLCSPTTHPGSFRCSFHRNISATGGQQNSNRLNARRSAMTNSLVRIGGVEGDLVKRALAALIRPSSHQQRRQAAFKPRRSRLSAMSMSDDL